MYQRIVIMPNASVRAAATGLPAANFFEITPSFRRALELLMDGLVLMLDELDADPDLEGVNEDGTDLDRGEGGAVDDIGEPTLGWTEREARTGVYRHNAQDDDEPTLGAGETCWPWPAPGTRWDGRPTPLKLDELEEVCEGEGAQREDEGAEHYGREPEYEG